MENPGLSLEEHVIYGRPCCAPLNMLAVALHAAALKKMPVSCDLKKWRDLHPETCPGSLVLFNLGIAFSLCFSLDRPRFSLLLLQVTVLRLMLRGGASKIWLVSTEQLLTLAITHEAAWGRNTTCSIPLPIFKGGKKPPSGWRWMTNLSAGSER